MTGDEPCEARDVGVDVIGLGVTRFQLGDVEQIVHVPEERARVANDDVEVATSRVRCIGRSEEALGRPEDQRQGRSQLVAHAREELRLELVELLGLLVQPLGPRVRFSQTVVEDAEEDPHRDEHAGREVQARRFHEGVKRRNEEPQHRTGREQRREHAGAQAADPRADEHGGVEEEPDVGIDEPPQERLDHERDDRWQEREEQPRSSTAVLIGCRHRHAHPFVVRCNKWG